jgi:hypothetical protein
VGLCPVGAEAPEPVGDLVSDDWNLVETLDFMPGSYLLPHVTRSLAGLGLDVRSALQAGDVFVVPATPEVDGERGLPAPLALFAPKGGKGVEEPGKVVNRLLCPEPTDGVQLKQLREGYLSSRPSKAYRTPIAVHTHNTVEDQRQRPTSDVGGVYTYEAIAAVDEGRPVRLCSELRLRKSLAERLASSQLEWWRKLDGVVSLGRSRKDDYGSVVLETKPAAAWTPTANADAAELFVWLVSDALIRNEQLRPEATAKALGEELGRRLEVKLINSLWGYQGEDCGHASFVVIDDAFIENSESIVVEVRDNVGIDRQWGAAAEHIKCDRAILPRGTQLELCVTVDVAKRENRNEALAMLAALQAALELGEVRLGAAKTRGLGQ